MMSIDGRRAFLGRMAAACLGLLCLAGTAQAREGLTVVATTGMIADAAREIGGRRVEVRALMGPGVDPHGYRQTRSDIVAMTRADLVLWHGLYLEAQMEAFLEKLARRQAVVAVAEGLPSDSLLAHEEYEDRVDPHVWMDPALWSEVVRVIRDALIEASPEDAEVFRDNAARFLQDIQELERYVREVTATVPAGNRVLVTAHDAFGYFGRAYDFEVVGIQGISTQSEAGLSRIRSLVDRLVEQRIPAVFVESSVSERNIRALIEGAGARGHEVRLGGELYSDAMGPTGTWEGRYLGMIDHNVTTIVRALGGQAPAGGLRAWRAAE
jgi:manganese/zinc/iron transport system substrate-binding protein